MQVSSVSNSFKQMMLLNNLLRYNPLDGGKTIIPDIATSWDVSEDGRVWTFPLREGVMFHNGAIMDAEDVAASWSRIINPPGGVISARKGLYDPFGPTIEVIDPLTVSFTFEKAPPLNYGLNAFALEWHGIFPKDFLESVGYDLKSSQEARAPALSGSWNTRKPRSGRTNASPTTGTRACPTWTRFGLTRWATAPPAPRRSSPATWTTPKRSTQPPSRFSRTTTAMKPNPSLPTRIWPSG